MSKDVFLQEASQDLALDLALAELLCAKAKQQGATDVDAMVCRTEDMNVRQANGCLERVTYAQQLAASIRLYKGNRQAMVQFDDLSPQALDRHIKTGLEMAMLVPEDAHGGLEPPTASEKHDQIAYHPHTWRPQDRLIQDVQHMEDVALKEKSVVRTWGVEAAQGKSCTTHFNSRGFVGQRFRTYHSRSAIVIAGSGTALERDYANTLHANLECLLDGEMVARSAAQLAVARLHARSVLSQKVTVVFPPRLMRRLIGILVGALSGQAVAAKTSFLLQDMGKKIFSPELTLIDDPHQEDVLGSRLFDCEGQATCRVPLIQEGVVQSWLLDCRSARRLGLKSLGHGARSLGGLPTPSASVLSVLPGETSTGALRSSPPQAFEVRELIGSGLNPVTGDFSFGASGQWLEKGEPAFPVHNVTLAGNIKELLKNIVIGDDTEPHHAILTPSGLVEGITLAGSAEK